MPDIDIKQLTPSEFCIECNGCCRFASDDPPWPPHNIRPVPDKKDDNFLCPYLDSGANRCKIYEKRPFECRLYPFLINYDKLLGKVFLSVDPNCPFVERDLKNKDFEEYTEYLAAFVQSPDFTRILNDNPGFVQSYPGTVNIVELLHEIKKVILER